MTTCHRIKALLRILVLFSFTAQLIIIPQSAHAEKPCWNDGSLAGGQGGVDEPPDDQECQPDGAEPVNLVTGSFKYKHQDVLISNSGLAIDFSRTYSNQDSYDGPFGYGWNHSYNIILFETSDGKDTYVIRRSNNYRLDRFKRNTDGSYESPAGTYDILMKQGNNYIIIEKHGTKYTFDINGKLLNIKDADNNQITLNYHPSKGILIAIIDPCGRQIDLSYNDNNKLNYITDFIGRTTSYSYDEKGNLKSVTSPATADYPLGLTTLYSYDNNHNLTQITDPKGNVYLVNQYNTDDKVESQEYGEGTFYFSYDTKRKITILTDRRGYKTEWTFDADGAPITKREYTAGLRAGDPAYYQTSYIYNDNLELTTIVYPRGNLVKYTYGNRGNIIEIRRKTSNQADSTNDIVYSYKYEPVYNQVKTFTDPLGNKYEVNFDYQEGADYTGLGAKINKSASEVQSMLSIAGIAMGLGDVNGDALTNQINGNAIKITCPEVTKGVTETQIITYLFTYNQYGQRINVTNPKGIVNQYSYDSNRYCNKIVRDYGGLNITTRAVRDNVGNITAITDPNGNTTNLTVNARNQITKITSPDPFNYQTKISYDENGLLEEIDRETEDANNSWQTTTMTYNSTDQIESITNELGYTTTYTYDLSNNLETVTDAEGNTTTYKYDERNNIMTETDAESNVTSYSYNANGRLSLLTDANNNKTTNTYDLFDRLITIIYPDDSTENYGYNKNSKVTSFTKRSNDTIGYYYDEINRMYKKDYPDGTNIIYTYDILGRLASITNAQADVTYTYDNLNRVLSTATNNKTIHYSYDANSNRTKITYPDNLEEISYVYDQLNRLMKIKNLAGQEIVSYNYNALNLRESMTYFNNISTSYNYDALSRLESIINPLSTINYNYDKVGNRKTITNNQGQHEYTYDDIYQLTNYQNPITNIQYNYDPAGNRTNVAGNSTTLYTSNNLNQYTSVGGVTYQYDTNGNLTTDGTNTYIYDYDNRLLSATRSTLDVNYSYDGFGRRVQKDANGTIINYLYDGANLLVEYNQNWQAIIYYTYSDYIDKPVTLTNANGVYYYHSDALGSITEITDSSGNLVEKYTYDVFGQPTIRNADDEITPTSTIGNCFMFTAREYDSETHLYYYRARYYDPIIGRFLQTDPLGYYDSTNLYTYCNNNPVNWVDPWGLAWKYKRPLDSGIARGIAGGIHGDYGGGRLHHEGFVYDNGTTSGYRGDSTVGPDTGSDTVMGQMEECGPKLNDNLLGQAEQNLANDWDQNVNPNSADYNLLNHNCQDYANAVMEEYRRLLEEARKRKCK